MRHICHGASLEARMTEYAFRSEPHIGPDGTRYRTVWRRAILDQSATFITLGEVQRTVVAEGKQSHPEWETTGGLLGRPCQITRERYRACGYSTRPPVEAQP
jgi:hypothetical protein